MLTKKLVNEVFSINLYLDAVPEIFPFEPHITGTLHRHISSLYSFTHFPLSGAFFFFLISRRLLDTKSWTALFPSFEFMNFVVALIVWSSRYPSVFWSTSKSFSLVFSIQMIANAVDLLLVFAGVSVIYKLQIVGQKLPLQVSVFIV